MKQIMQVFKLIAGFSAGLAATIAATSAGVGDVAHSHGRAADAPEELEHFAFLVGCFELETYSRNDAGTDWVRIGGGEWLGRWAQGGWAIYDEWSGIPFPGWEEDMARGANMRVYHPDGRRFVIAALHTNAQETRDRRARRVGDKIVVWQPSPAFDGFNWEARFTFGEGGRWTRTDITSPLDAPKDFTEIRKIEASPVECSTGLEKE